MKLSLKRTPVYDGCWIPKEFESFSRSAWRYLSGHVYSLYLSWQCGGGGGGRRGVSGNVVFAVVVGGRWCVSFGLLNLIKYDPAKWWDSMPLLYHCFSTKGKIHNYMTAIQAWTSYWLLQVVRAYTASFTTGQIQCIPSGLSQTPSQLLATHLRLPWVVSIYI